MAFQFCRNLSVILSLVLSLVFIAVAPSSAQCDTSRCRALLQDLDERTENQFLNDAESPGRVGSYIRSALLEFEAYPEVTANVRIEEPHLTRVPDPDSGRFQSKMARVYAIRLQEQKTWIKILIPPEEKLSSFELKLIAKFLSREIQFQVQSYKSWGYEIPKQVRWSTYAGEKVDSRGELFIINLLQFPNGEGAMNLGSHLDIRSLETAQTFIRTVKGEKVEYSLDRRFILSHELGHGILLKLAPGILGGPGYYSAFQEGFADYLGWLVNGRTQQLAQTLERARGSYSFEEASATADPHHQGAYTFQLLKDLTLRIDSEKGDAGVLVLQSLLRKALFKFGEEAIRHGSDLHFHVLLQTLNQAFSENPELHRLFDIELEKRGLILNPPLIPTFSFDQRRMSRAGLYPKRSSQTVNKITAAGHDIRFWKARGLRFSLEGKIYIDANGDAHRLYTETEVASPDAYILKIRRVGISPPLPLSANTFDLRVELTDGQKVKLTSHFDHADSLWRDFAQFLLRQVQESPSLYEVHFN